MKTLLSDEKLFNIDGIYNSQNDCISTVSRVETDKRGVVKQKRKFPQKVMVWLGVCSKGVSPIVIFYEGTIDHARYIREVLPVALKYGNDYPGNLLNISKRWHKASCPSSNVTMVQRQLWPLSIDKNH